MVQLAPYQYGVIKGLMLSDGWITLSTKYSKNARIGFKQSVDHASYVWFVFNLLSHYCGSYPQLTIGVRSGKRSYGLQFFTRAMPCITELYYLFYPKGVKTIPHNIYEILTPIALAHLITGVLRRSCNKNRISSMYGFLFNKRYGSFIKCTCN